MASIMRRRCMVHDESFHGAQEKFFWERLGRYMRSKHASGTPSAANRLRPDSQFFRVSGVSERSADEIFAAAPIKSIDRHFRALVARVAIDVWRGSPMILSYKLYMERRPWRPTTVSIKSGRRPGLILN
jgi:hypothetical protein